MDERDIVNNLVESICTRLRELGDMKMDELRIVAGYNCDTYNEAISMNRYKSRGQLLEEIIMEEFYRDIV